MERKQADFRTVLKAVPAANELDPSSEGKRGIEGNSQGTRLNYGGEI